MNNTNRYIANLYLVMLNMRDTLEFCLLKDHPLKVYQARKAGIESALIEKSAMKNFLDNNGEKGKEIEGKIKEFLEEIYGENSTILVPSGDLVRVDHTQHIKIYEFVVGLVETLRDVLVNYLNYAKQQNESEEVMENLIKKDEALYRSVFFKLCISDLEKSFVEFNKVMNESKGKATPQSNFIVQNEILKYASNMRFVRSHCRLTDNYTLDLLDETLELIEMTEGRRDRREGKSFKDLFTSNREHLDIYIKTAEANWKEAYKPVLEEMIQLSKAAEEKAKENK